MFFLLNNIAHPGVRLLVERTISGGGEDAGISTGDSLNIIIVVIAAVGISFLAQWLSRRGRRK